MTSTTDLTESWYTPEFFDDPYPFYDAVRCLEPVHWSAKLNGWIVTGFAQVDAILRQSQIFSSAGRMAALLDALPEQDRDSFQPVYDHFAVGMIRSDPPDHTRLRRLISAAFTPQVIRQSRQNVGGVVDELLDVVPDGQAVDLVTTEALITNAVVTLLRHPEQVRLFLQEPSLLPAVVEEVLRYESPLQRQTRVLKQDTRFDGRQMRAGQVVFLMLGAANRDPDVFPEPDQFDIQRQDNRHIAFGIGTHFCIGAPLARLEAELALSQLLKRFPDIQLATDQIQWARTAALRCPASLPVRLGTPPE